MTAAPERRRLADPVCGLSHLRADRHVRSGVLAHRVFDAAGSSDKSCAPAGLDHREPTPIR